MGVYLSLTHPDFTVPVSRFRWRQQWCTRHHPQRRANVLLSLTAGLQGLRNRDGWVQDLLRWKKEEFIATKLFQGFCPAASAPTRPWGTPRGFPWAASSSTTGLLITILHRDWRVTKQQLVGWLEEDLLGYCSEGRLTVTAHFCDNSFVNTILWIHFQLLEWAQKEL